MNKRRRESLRDARRHMEIASGIIDRVFDEEDDSLGNIPENLQYTDRYEKSETAVNSMSSAMEMLENAIDSVDTAISM